MVRHRIDGLEKPLTLTTSSIRVRHRIDGLEIHHGVPICAGVVRHRIDGLENLQVFSRN